jgi:hypothetical protein
MDVALKYPEKNFFAGNEAQAPGDFNFYSPPMKIIKNFIWVSGSAVESRASQHTTDQPRDLIEIA